MTELDDTIKEAQEVYNVLVGAVLDYYTKNHPDQTYSPAAVFSASLAFFQKVGTAAGIKVQLDFDRLEATIKPRASA